MIAVVDYQKGNLKSVERGLIAAGGEALITADASKIAKADAIVLPGVGAFADAAATMCELGQMEAIRDRVRAGVPFLGICLGEHLMFEHGVEGAPEGNPACGLGLLPGTVIAMPRCDAQGKTFKVPHAGWNTIEMPACNGGRCSPSVRRRRGKCRAQTVLASLRNCARHLPRLRRTARWGTG